MELEIRDFRIDNWVEHDGNAYQLASVSEDFPLLKTQKFGIGVITWQNINPIELTRDWIRIYYLDLGLQVHNAIFSGIIRVKKESKHWQLYIGNVHIRTVKYIHEVQNLILTLTGRELTLDNGNANQQGT